MRSASLKQFVGVASTECGSAPAVAVIERSRPTRLEQDPLSWSFGSGTRLRVRQAARFPASCVAEQLRRIIETEAEPGSTIVVMDAARPAALLEQCDAGVRVELMPPSAASEALDGFGAGHRWLYGLASFGAVRDSDIERALAFACWRATREIFS